MYSRYANLLCSFAKRIASSTAFFYPFFLHFYGAGRTVWTVVILFKYPEAANYFISARIYAMLKRTTGKSLGLRQKKLSCYMLKSEVEN